MQLKIYNLIITLLLVGCINNSKSIQFSIINDDYKTIELSKTVDESTLKEYIKSSELRNFTKLILTQSNGDKLIVEQKDKDGFLVLLSIRFEQFAIETPPKTINEVTNIMIQYLKEKNAIMNTIKFY